METAAVYVRVNHQRLVTIDRKKMPLLFEFLSKYFENMMEVLTEDFKKMEAANANKENPEIYKAKCPIKYITVQEFFNFAQEVKNRDEKVTALTICFGMTRLICDIRIDRREMIQKQLESIANGTNKNTIGELKFQPKILN